MDAKPQVGDKIDTWFSEMPDGKSRVLAVRNYLGCYPEMFKWVVTVTAPNTVAGKIDMCI